MGMKSGGGEIVQVQGGHIVRSIGRKDRHSKVYTAKGPRDRRVRLSAHTAIQFYDVQDRLGYDRPSKAVDWLINKAKSAIDKLAELPPWNPSSTAEEEHPNNTGGIPHNDESSFVPPPPPMASESIEDTMKSFFPTSSASSSINFQSYPPEMIQRNANPTQDLGLSLHCFHDQTPPNDHTLFSGQFDTNFREGGGGGFAFNAPPLSEQSLFGQSSAPGFAQRGTLQSSFSVRAWEDLPMAAQRTQPIQHSSSVFGLPMFCIPARIQGEDDEQNGVVSGRPPSSPSPKSNHHH